MKFLSLITYIHIHLISSIYLSLANQNQNDNNSHHQNQNSQNYHLSDIPEESRKFITNQLKANILRDLGFSVEPKPKSSKRVAVPRAMLEEYLNFRDSMRDAVPDDGDFYGNLDVSELKETIKDTSEVTNSPTSTSSRDKRHVTSGTSPRREKDKRCNRRSLEINFEQVGWSNWIVAPKSYNAFYCGGDCTFPMADHQNASNHAIIQSIYHSVGRLVPKSCCAPLKLGRMAILYQLDDQVNLKRYEDMIVESCACM